MKENIESGKSRMNVKGKTMVFKNQKDDRVWYNISDSSKDTEGNYINQSYNARFLRGQEPKDRSRIEYEGFMTYYQKNEDIIYTSVQIMSWKYVDEQPNNKPVVTETDLPF